MSKRGKENLSMLCDYYELTMGNGYFRKGMGEQKVYFDLFFRKVPDGGSPSCRLNFSARCAAFKSSIA